MTAASFDPTAYKRNTRDQWYESGAGYAAWGDTVQSIIRPAAEHMMDTIGLQVGNSVLVLACGGGALTLMLTERVGEEGDVLATDLSPGMVALAKANLDRAGWSQVEVREMDGEVLDIGDRRFDRVCRASHSCSAPIPRRRFELRSGRSLEAAPETCWPPAA